MNGGDLVGLNFLGETVDGNKLYVEYARESPRVAPTVQVDRPKRSRWRGKFLPNTGTIVNTAPRLSRNALVSVDGGPTMKLKRTVLRAHGVPFEVIPNRRQKPEQE